MGLGAGLIAIFSVYQSMNHISYCLDTDSLFSSKAVDSISEYVTTHAQTIPEKLTRELITTFCSIDQVTARCNAQGTCTLSVTAVKPLARLSNAMLLSVDGKCVPQECFVETATKNLSAISLCDTLSEQAAQALSAYIQKISPHVFNNYTVAWKNKNEIFFHDKNTDVLFLADLKTTPNERLHQLIVDHRTCTSKPTQKKQKKLIADIRFDHQLIVYENKGASHGNSIF